MSGNFKKINPLLLHTWALTFMVILTVPANAEVGVSITVDRPEFYGRIDIGEGMKPKVIYESPVVVEHVRVVEKPIYLRVPPGHAEH